VWLCMAVANPTMLAILCCCIVMCWPSLAWGSLGFQKCLAEL
jgi:hypothetical protein